MSHPLDPKSRAVRAFAGAGLALAAAGAVLAYVAGGMAISWQSIALLLVCLASFLGAAASLKIAFVVQFFSAIAARLPRFAFGVFLGGLVMLVAIPWAPRLLFDLVDRIIVQVPTAEPLTVAQIQSYLAGAAQSTVTVWTLPACILWPLQFQIVRDVLTVVGVLGFVSLVAMFGIWWERKVAGRIQSRLGPMRVGGWHGWAQSLADGLKLIQKEDIKLEGADNVLFKLAPYLAFIPAVNLFIVLPFGAAWVCRDLDVGLIFIFAMFGVGVLGVLLAGWSSNNKWSMYGAMREACQMISYEVPMGFSLLVPVMTVGSLRLTAIGDAQSGGFHHWLAFSNPFTLIAAGTFFIASLASCKRAPFDLPEAESELVAGYHTEYSGFRWALFFFAEYAEMFAVGALATILFFGAWHSPLPASWGAHFADGNVLHRGIYGLLFSGPLWLVGKGLFFLYVQIWLRWTLPRVRLDQVMYACVQVLLPITMVVLLGNTFWKLLVRGGSAVDVVANLLCTAVGVLAVIGIVRIIIRGYANRRKLVGTLVIDHKPGY